LLLLITQKRQVGIKQIVCGVEVTSAVQANEVAQHVGESVAGVGAVCTSAQLKVQEQTAISTQDGDVAHLPFSFETAQR
jgi:hypothetical protein